MLGCGGWLVSYSVEVITHTRVRQLILDLHPHHTEFPCLLPSCGFQAKFLEIKKFFFISQDILLRLKKHLVVDVGRGSGVGVGWRLSGG